jgi:hypothetical protein
MNFIYDAIASENEGAGSSETWAAIFYSTQRQKTVILTFTSTGSTLMNLYAAYTHKTLRDRMTQRVYTLRTYEYSSELKYSLLFLLLTLMTKQLYWIRN